MGMCVLSPSYFRTLSSHMSNSGGAPNLPRARSTLFGGQLEQRNDLLQLVTIGSAATYTQPVVFVSIAVLVGGQMSDRSV